MIAVALRPTEAVTHHIRLAIQVAPGRPALSTGLRMAAAMTLPLVLSPWLPPVTATTASLAGYFITLVDKGGAYRTRARAMALASLGAVCGVIVGVMVTHTRLAPPVVIAGFTACAFGHYWGATGAAIANPFAVLLALACFRPGAAWTFSEALLGTAFGAGWAMLLALVLWPVRVYRPTQQALATALDELGDLATAMATSVSTRGDRDSLLARHRQIRTQLETTRSVAVATRRGRSERQRSERLLAIVYMCDRIFGKLLALEEALDDGEARGDAAAIVRTLHDHAAILHELAELVGEEGKRSAALSAIAKRLAAAARPSGSEQVSFLLHTNAEHLATTARLIASLDEGGSPEPALVAAGHEPMSRQRVRDVLQIDSAVFRHVIRVAIATAIAVVIALAIHVAYSYWIIITAYVLLLPQRSATTTRAIQRGLGTVVGALIAAGLVALIPQQSVLIAITIVFAAIGASMLQLNFGLFSLFVTPTFVLLAELQTQDFTLFGVRIAYTLLGGAIAFLATLLLWPSRERTELDDLLANAIDAEARYLGAVREAVATRAPIPSPEITHARRTFGLALGNAELALDRRLAERAPTEVIEPRMSAIAAARRLGGAINVLGTTRLLATVDADRDERARYAELLEARLYALAAALRDRQSVTEPSLAGPTALRRLGTHVDALASAIARAPK